MRGAKIVLPDDLIILILRRLKTNSPELYTFRRVCKRWNNWISVRRHLLLTTIERKTTGYSIFDYYSMNRAGKLIEEKVLDLKPVSFYITYLSTGLPYVLLRQGNWSLHLFNPVNQDFITLPEPKDPTETAALGYVPEKNAFVVLRTFADLKSEVFVPGRSRRWKQVPKAPFLLETRCSSAYLHGAINFLKEYECQGKKRPKIASFLVRQERWRTITFPEKCCKHVDSFELKEVRGFLCVLAYCFVRWSGEFLEIWRLTDYSNERSWEKMHKFDRICYNLKPLVTIWDDKTMLFSGRSALCEYDLRLDFGFKGYQALEIPRVPKSAKGKRSARRKVDGNQMYAFDLPAAVAGKILMHRECSISSGDVDFLSDKIKKELLENFKPYKEAAFDQASCNESIIDTNISLKEFDFMFKNPNSSPSPDLLEKDVKLGGLPPISIEEEIAAQTEKQDETSEDPMVLDVKSSTLASSVSSVEVPHYRDNNHQYNSCTHYRDAMESNLAGDDDDNLSRCTYSNSRMAKAFKSHRGADRIIRKLSSSKQWKAAPGIPRDGEPSNIEVKPVCRSGKLLCTRQRTQKSSFKRRKVLERCSAAAFDAYADWNGNCDG